MRAFTIASVVLYVLLIKTVYAACPADCKTCVNSDQCQECNENFFLESATSCKPCSDISSACLKCSSKLKKCEQCQNKFLNQLDFTCVDDCPTPTTFASGLKTEVRQMINLYDSPP